MRTSLPLCLLCLTLLGAASRAQAELHLRHARSDVGLGSGALEALGTEVEGCVEGATGRVDVVAARVGRWVDGTYRSTWEVRIEGARGREPCVRAALETPGLVPPGISGMLWWSSVAGSTDETVALDPETLDGKAEGTLAVVGPNADAWLRVVVATLPAIVACREGLGADPPTAYTFDLDDRVTMLTTAPAGLGRCVSHALAGAGGPNGWVRVRLFLRTVPRHAPDEVISDLDRRR